MRKKGVALFVAALMVAALAFPVGANVNPFSDLRSDHWAYEAVIKLAAAGLVEGYPDGTFGGDRTFTRYEMAMVFARILARFEALIDDKIAEGIDAKAEQLALEIEAVRKALSERIDENYEDLLARIRGLELELGDVRASLDDPQAAPGGSASGEPAVVERVIERVEVQPVPVAAELTDEARAALADQLMDQMLDQLRILLREDIDDLARRVRNLERSMLTERDVQRIARQLIADALSAHAAEIEAAEGDAAATARLIEGRVNDLEDALAQMALEFRGELAQLGVQVRVLEARIDRVEGRVDEQQEQINDLLSRIGNFAFSGKNKTTFEHTAVDGNPNIAHMDPRNEDSDTFVPGVKFDNTFTLTLKATPAENVNVTASLEATNRLNPIAGTEEDSMALKGNLSVTTPGVLRSLQVGDLSMDEVSSPFSKYALDKDALDNAFDDFRGAHVDVVWGLDDSTNLHGFITRSGEGEQTYGAYTSYKLSDAFNLAYEVVQRSATIAAGANADSLNTVYGVGSKGALDVLDYSVYYATSNDDGTTGNVMEARASLPISIVTASVEYGTVDEDFKPAFGKELDSGDGMVFNGLDWLERYLTPAADWLDQGESTMAAKFSTAILGIPVAASFGTLTADDQGADPATTTVTNNFVRAEVGKLSWAGIDASLLYDRRTDDNEDQDQTIRATFGTTLLGAEVAATIHNRVNDQVSWRPAAEAEQNHVWVTAKSKVNLLLPLTLEGRFGSSQTAAPKQHTYVGVSVDELPVGPFTVSAGYSMSQNDVDAGKWWINDKWSSDDIDTITFGVGYLLREFFGTDVQTKYEYKLVRKNNDIDGTARNTFSASFDKELRGGEARLSGEGKLVTGGSSSDKRTGSDLIAKLNLTYPVFAGGDLVIGGTYVSSTGDTNVDGQIKDDYSAFQLKAGLEFGF